MVTDNDNNMNDNDDIVERFLKVNKKQGDELIERQKKLQDLIKRSKESGREPSVDVGEMLLALESVLEDAVREGIISKEASTYIQDTMEEISADHGYI